MIQIRWCFFAVMKAFHFLRNNELSYYKEGKQKFSLLEIFCFAGMLFVYLSHLGYPALDTETDEARRALVAAEMMLSGDYITPTLNGEIYLNKPPLYNWIVTFYFKIFGNNSMFAFRLQVIVATFLLAFAAYRFIKKYSNHTIAFFTAFAFLTNGRILIYDSLQGLIDTTFALCVFSSFMLTWYLGEYKKYIALFISTYLLCTAGYMMKGLPAIVFQGFTLLTYFILTKQFKKFFHWAHFAGGALFLLITGAYYYIYFTRNDLSPEVLFKNLFVESAKRTPGEFPASRGITHFFVFPLELLYHFAPWTIFIFACFQKKFWVTVKANRFVQYCLWVLVVNIFIYWISPEVYPRYLFMFLPLLFFIVFFFYFDQTTINNWRSKIPVYIIAFLCVVLFAAGFVLPFIDAVNKVQHIYLKCFCLIAGFGFALWLLYKRKPLPMHAFAVAIIFVRMSFNWFVVEQRGARFFEAEKTGKAIVSQTKGSPLHIMYGTDVGNLDGISFHVSTGREEVLKYSKEIISGEYYIADKKQLQGKSYERYFAFTNYFASDSLILVRMK